MHDTTLQLQLHYFTHTTLDYTTLYYSRVHNTTLHYSTLHYTTLDYTTLTLQLQPQLQLQLHYAIYTTLQLQLHYTTTTTTTAVHHATSSNCEWGDHCNQCNHPKKHNSNHLSVHQWIRSAIPDSQQPSSPIGFLFLNFHHRLVRHYWYILYTVYIIFIIYISCAIPLYIYISLGVIFYIHRLKWINVHMLWLAFFWTGCAKSSQADDTWDQWTAAEPEELPYHSRLDAQHGQRVSAECKIMTWNVSETFSDSTIIRDTTWQR